MSLSAVHNLVLPESTDIGKCLAASCARMFVAGVIVLMCLPRTWFSKLFLAYVADKCNLFVGCRVVHVP